MGCLLAGYPGRSRPRYGTNGSVEPGSDQSDGHRQILHRVFDPNVRVQGGKAG